MPFTLTAKQNAALALLGGPARHVLGYGGAGSGKTFFFLRATVIRALKAPASRHCVFRFRFNHLKASVIHDTFPKVMATCWPDLDYHLDKSDWFCEYENGSQIWFGGLDDKERTEKILGQEFVTGYLNECSQIPYSSRLFVVTRLRQLVTYQIGDTEVELTPKMYYDENPPSMGHWSYSLFIKKVDPESKQRLNDPDNYACFQLNPKDNVENLPTSYMEELQNQPARMKRRFWHGEFGEAAPGALWTEEMIEAQRVIDMDLPDMQRVVVAVDPSGADDDDNAENDEIGIVVAGLGTDGRGYLLEDISLKAGPKTWGNVAVTAWDRWQGDKIVAEVNYGGEMVRHVIQTAAAAMQPRQQVPFRKLTASRGKVVRAEPISSLTEQGKIKFAGKFTRIEDELLSFTTTGYQGSGSPNRADAFIWAMSELFPGLTAKLEKKEPPPPKHYPRGAGNWMA